MSQQVLVGMGGAGDAVLTMDNRPSGQGGGSGEIGTGPFTVDSSTNLTVSDSNAEVRIRVAGTSRGGAGHYVEGTILMRAGQTYHLYKHSDYAAVFYGSGATSAPVCIMLGAEGGHNGRAPGGAAGYPSGSSGSNKNNSGGGGGGTTNGYLSGSGGPGGPRGGSPGLPAGPGGNGGLFSYGPGGGGTDGNGGRGGFGYYGGGGGGGGWDYNADYGDSFGGGGGGGASYAGGLPGSAPYPAPVTSVQTGSNGGGSYITLVSVTPA
tara:strand:+ start:492 stop:1283 length:792 start_codon:yes stop_codon:yes gene_type:complete